MLDAEEHALDIDCLLLAPGFKAHFGHQTANTDPSIVDEHIEAAELGADVCNHADPLVFAGHVLMQIDRLAAALVDGGADRLAYRILNIGQDDRCPRLC